MILKNLSVQLKIQVKPGSPRMELNSDLKEKIMAAMAKLYEAKPEALDLCRFYADPGERSVTCNTHTYTEC
jgi:hypothetical protein